MTALRLQTGLLSFAVLSSAVFVNMLYLQPVPQGQSVTPGAIAVASQPAASQPALTEAVRGIQRELAARGYATGPAGSGVTPVLQAAIMAYEFDQGLALTGEPGEGLLRAIILGPGSADMASAGAKPGPVAQQIINKTQEMLRRLGYGPLKADGVMPDALAAAIRRFEREQGMPESGRISGDLISRLSRQAELSPVPGRR